jgi:hypothetical protein
MYDVYDNFCKLFVLPRLPCQKDGELGKSELRVASHALTFKTLAIYTLTI